MSKPSKLLKLMASIRPTKMWIDGKCFDIANSKHTEVKEEDAYGHFDINSLEDGKFSTAFCMPSVYYEKLKSLPHFHLKHLEKETNTSIVIPASGSGNITVTGGSIDEVGLARTKLQSLFSLIRDRYIALQFTSIPVHSEEIQANFKKFKEEIINGEKIEGMHESIFQKPEKLHLTIAVFVLLDDAEKAEAKQIMDDCKRELLDPLVSEYGPLKIKLAGIDCMNNNHSKVNILFANAKLVGENEGGHILLQNIVNSIYSRFYERGLVCRYQENVKLHVTLINSKYRIVQGRKKQWTDKKIAFDARPIMEKYKDFVFGESNFESLHLSQISSVGEDGFYKPLHVVRL